MPLRSSTLFGKKLVLVHRQLLHIFLEEVLFFSSMKHCEIVLSFESFIIQLTNPLNTIKSLSNQK